MPGPRPPSRPRQSREERKRILFTRLARPKKEYGLDRQSALLTRQRYVGILGEKMWVTGRGYFRQLRIRGIDRGWNQLTPVQQRRAADFLIKLSIRSIRESGLKPRLKGKRAHYGTFRVTRKLENEHEKIESHLDHIRARLRKFKKTDASPERRELKQLEKRLTNLGDVLHRVILGVANGDYWSEGASSENVHGIDVNQTYSKPHP